MVFLLGSIGEIYGSLKVSMYQEQQSSWSVIHLVFIAMNFSGISNDLEISKREVISTFVSEDRFLKVTIINVEFDLDNPLYPESAIPSDYNPYNIIGEVLTLSQDFDTKEIGNCVLEFVEEWIDPLFPITKLVMDIGIPSKFNISFA